MVAARTCSRTLVSLRRVTIRPSTLPIPRSLAVSTLDRDITVGGARRKRSGTTRFTNSSELSRTYQWRRLAKSFKLHCRSVGEHCWLCGNAIDYDAPPNTPESFETDHYIPVVVDPSLALSRSNLRASHCGCNRRRGADDARNFKQRDRKCDNVIVVTGPPGAGKSTWAQNNADVGDVIVDFDLILKSLAPHGDPSKHAIDTAYHMWIATVDYLLSPKDSANGHRSIIIHPKPNDKMLARYRGASIISLDPGIDVCRQRIVDRNRSDLARSLRLLNAWYDDKP